MDATCLTIVGALAAAVAGEAAYIVRLHLKVSALYDERIRALERQLERLGGGEPPRAGG